MSQSSPSWESIKARLLQKRVVFGLDISSEDLDTMKHGEQMNGRMLNMFAEAVFKGFGAHKHMGLMDSQVSAAIIRGELHKVASLPDRLLGLDACVGILHVEGCHWVAFRADRKVTVQRSLTALTTLTVGAVEMRVLDSLKSDRDMKQCGLYSLEGQSGQRSLRPFAKYKCDEVYEKLLNYLCCVWFERTYVNSIKGRCYVEGTSQQHDGWACGRWALANLGGLITPEGSAFNAKLVVPTTLSTVANRLLKLAEVLLCGQPCEKTNNPLQFRYIVIDD